MTQLSLLPKTGAELKAEGMQSVLEHQGQVWKTAARHLVLLFFHNTESALMEDARQFCIDCGLPTPTHPNAWGALTGALAKAGEITPTGEYTASTDPRSHARMQPKWRAT